MPLLAHNGEILASMGVTGKLFPVVLSMPSPFVSKILTGNSMQIVDIR